MLSKKGNYEEYLQYAYAENNTPNSNVVKFYENHRLSGSHKEKDVNTVRSEYFNYMIEWAKERLGVYNVIRFWGRGSRWRFKSKIC